jgi:hypothetical protein
VLNASTGGLSLLDGSPTGQTLLPEVFYDLQLRVDTAQQTWGALLNGVWICKDLPLPAGTTVQAFQASWAGAFSNSGSMLVLNQKPKN